MIALFCLCLALFASPFKSKGRLEAENAALRHQLIILRRKVRGRVRLTDGDRLFLIQLYRWFPSVLKAITIVRPETLVRWHRAGFWRTAQGASTTIIVEFSFRYRQPATSLRRGDLRMVRNDQSASAWYTSALIIWRYFQRIGPGVCAMNTTTSSSRGSTHQLVPLAPGQEKSPTEPIMRAMPGVVRTARPRPKP